MAQRIAVMTADAGYWSWFNAELCAAETRAHAQRWRCQKQDGPQDQKQSGISDLRPAQGDRRADERSDQRSLRIAPLPAEGSGERRCGMAPDRCHAQPAQAVSDTRAPRSRRSAPAAMPGSLQAGCHPTTYRPAQACVLGILSSSSNTASASLSWNRLRAVPARRNRH
jgi:hypothetical protein